MLRLAALTVLSCMSALSFSGSSLSDELKGGTNSSIGDANSTYDIEADIQEIGVEGVLANMTRSFNTPYPVGNYVMMISVEANGKKMQQKYLVTMLYENEDHGKKAGISKLCSNTIMRSLLDHGAVFERVFVNQAGAELSRYQISSASCGS